MKKHVRDAMVGIGAAAFLLLAMTATFFSGAATVRLVWEALKCGWYWGYMLL